MSDAREEKMEGLHEGLSPLAENDFPKRCNNCGKVYAGVGEFLSQTQPVRRFNGFKESVEGGKKALDLFRNCICGSTLMESFHDRRDYSGRGDMRRMKFNQLLDSLVCSGIKREVAHQELKKIFRGGKSEILKGYNIDIE